MRRIQIFFLMVGMVFFSACSTYYHAENPAVYLPDSTVFDTAATYYKYVRSGEQEMVFIERFSQNKDTIVSTSLTMDSTFYDVSTYLITSQALTLYSEFYLFNMNWLFFNIKRNIAFGLNPRKTGYMDIKKVLDAPQFYQKIRMKSIGSESDTLRIADTLLHVLRVDVRNRQIFRDKKDKTVERVSQILHFYYYPGYGQIYVKGDDYEEKTLNLKFKKTKP